MRAWADQGLQISVAINLLVHQLRKRVDEVAQALRAQGLAHGSGSADGLG